MRSVAVLLLALAACDKLATRANPETQCTRDEDCTLVPSELTCCIDCAPAPPFQAAPVWVVDGMYIENEDRCLETDRECPKITCANIPLGCSARAVCAAGRCAAVATGCGIPTS